MADKNKNGIDDKKEQKSLRDKGVFPFPFTQHAFDTSRPVRPTTYNQRGFLGLGEVGNFFTDTGRNLENFWDSAVMGNDRKPGQGVGDYLYGSAHAPASKKAPKKPSPDGGVPPELPQFDMPPSFMSFLQEALQNSPVAGVNFDPQREDARRRGSEYDARLAAMYDQLQGAMRDDNTALQGSYQGAIDDASARNAAVQQQIQASSNVADDRNAQVLKNLGIEQAQGNIVNEGRDLNTQTAKSIADAAARGQITGDALGRNQQSAAQAGNSLVGAAGLEGNLQRARVQDQLSQLLAQYDMQEQEANRQAQQQSFAQAMGLANAMYDDDWRRQGYQDDMTKYLMQQSAQRTDPMQYSMNFIGQLQKAYPDLDMEQIIKLLGPAASIGKLAN